MKKVAAFLLSSKSYLIFSLVLYFGMTVFSVYAMELKRDALGFHTRDYNYYIEQAARFAEPVLINRFSTNIEGYNMIGLQGIEGVKSLYQAIHNEYFRYTYVLLYLIFKDLLPIYIFFCGCYFLPILYSAWVTKQVSTSVRLFMLIFILLYVFFPGVIQTTSGDLRSRLLFSSAWSLTIMSIYFERPFAEKLLFLIILPFIREEGIILGAIVTTLNFITMNKKQGRFFQTGIFSAILLTAFLAFLAFMSWGGYTRVDSQFNPLTTVGTLFQKPLFIVFLILGGTILGVMFFRFRFQPGKIYSAFYWIFYSVILGLTGIQYLSDFNLWYSFQLTLGPVSFWDIYLTSVTSYQISLLYTASVLLFPLVGISLGRRKRWPLFISAGLILSLIVSTTIFSLPRQIASWREGAIPARLIWDFKATHNPYTTHLLVDFATYQAFYNFDSVLVYNRLPVWMVYPNLNERFYPQNKDLAAKAIKNGIDYAVISRGSLENFNELVQMAGRQPIEIGSNAAYMIFQLH